jgi:anti-sigma-K factor RskA
VTCAEFKELVAAYALGALDAEEQAAAEAHLRAASHEGCRDALHQAEQVADSLATALPLSAPEAGTWVAIEARLGLGRRARGSGRPRRFVARTLPWVLLAAAALALAWMSDRHGRELAARDARLGVAEGIERERNDAVTLARTAEDARRRCESDLGVARAQLDRQTQAVALLGRPATRVVSFAPQGQASAGATAIVNLAERRAMVVAHGVEAPAGKDYELWVIKGDQKLAAGLLRSQGAAQVIAEVDPALLANGADALAVTLEPAGGTPQPSGALVLVAALPRS